MQRPKVVRSGDTASIVLSVKQLPEIKNWRIGGRYRVLLELEQTADDEHGASFNILQSQAMPTTLSRETVLKVMAEKAKT